MRYHYSLQGASDAGEAEHPEVVIRRHFPDARGFEPESFGDCWFFEAEPIDELPVFFLPCGADGVPNWGYHRRGTSW